MTSNSDMPNKRSMFPFSAALPLSLFQSILADHSQCCLHHFIQVNESHAYLLVSSVFITVAINCKVSIIILSLLSMSVWCSQTAPLSSIIKRYVFARRLSRYIIMPLIILLLMKTPSYFSKYSFSTATRRIEVSRQIFILSTHSTRFWINNGSNNLTPL